MTGCESPTPATHRAMYGDAALAAAIQLQNLEVPGSRSRAGGGTLFRALVAGFTHGGRGIIERTAAKTWRERAFDNGSVVDNDGIVGTRADSSGRRMNYEKLSAELKLHVGGRTEAGAGRCSRARSNGSTNLAGHVLERLAAGAVGSVVSGCPRRRGTSAAEADRTRHSANAPPTRDHSLQRGADAGPNRIRSAPSQAEMRGENAAKYAGVQCEERPVPSRVPRGGFWGMIGVRSASRPRTVTSDVTGICLRQDRQARRSRIQ